MHSATKQPLRELNPHLLCVLCGGYLIDATTIIECIHSFCRTCIIKYLESSKYCPICDVQVHKTKPLLNVRSDKTLQTLVYKLVPSLFKDEMRRRREFYASHPDSALQPAINASEIRGEVNGDDASVCPADEEEQISVCLQHSLRLPPFKNENLCSVKYPAPTRIVDSRHLLCPSSVTVGHLKKFIRAKYELPPAFRVDVFYSDEGLRDAYTLLDIVNIYAWRRAEPLKLFYLVHDKNVSHLQLSPPSVKDTVKHTADRATCRKNITQLVDGVEGVNVQLEDEEGVKLDNALAEVTDIPPESAGESPAGVLSVEKERGEVVDEERAEVVEADAMVAITQCDTVSSMCDKDVVDTMDDTIPSVAKDAGVTEKDSGNESDVHTDGKVTPKEMDSEICFVEGTVDDTIDLTNSVTDSEMDDKPHTDDHTETSSVISESVYLDISDSRPQIDINDNNKGVDIIVELKEEAHHGQAHTELHSGDNRSCSSLSATSTSDSADSATSSLTSGEETTSNNGNNAVKKLQEKAYDPYNFDETDAIDSENTYTSVKRPNGTPRKNNNGNSIETASESPMKSPQKQNLVGKAHVSIQPKPSPSANTIYQQQQAISMQNVPQPYPPSQQYFNNWVVPNMLAMQQQFVPNYYPQNCITMPSGQQMPLFLVGPNGQASPIANHGQGMPFMTMPQAFQFQNQQGARLPQMVPTANKGLPPGYRGNITINSLVPQVINKPLAPVDLRENAAHHNLVDFRNSPTKSKKKKVPTATLR